MLDESTRNKISELRLTAMLQAWDHLVANQQLAQLDACQTLKIIIDHEYLYRQNKKRDILVKFAQLREKDACVQEIDYQHPRKLPKEQLQVVCSSQFIADKQNMLLIGPTGIGKTYIACAIASNACNFGYRVRYFRLSKLKEQVRLSFADGSYSKFLQYLARLQLLVIDDFGIEVMDEQTRNALLEIIDDRFGLQSTIIASQLPVSHWYDYFGNATIADAFLDRMVHSSVKIILEGDSLRKANS